MEKVVIAQQHEYGRHSTAAFKVAIAQQGGKGDIVEHHGKGRHSAAAFKK